MEIPMTQLYEQYKKLGISEEVYRFGEEILASLSARFTRMDQNAE